MSIIHHNQKIDDDNNFVKIKAAQTIQVILEE